MFSFVCAWIDGWVNNREAGDLSRRRPHYVATVMNALCSSQQPYNQRSDLWSAGCVLYELITFRPPFQAATFPALVLSIVQGEYPPLSRYALEQPLLYEHHYYCFFQQIFFNT